MCRKERSEVGKEDRGSGEGGRCHSVCRPPWVLPLLPREVEGKLPAGKKVMEDNGSLGLRCQ